MRRIVLICLVCVLLATASPDLRADEPEDAPVRVWKGYLWKDDEGRLQIGWPVVAMGVESQPAHVVECPDNTVLAPLVSKADDSFVFWNYTLEDPIEDALLKLPTVLVGLRGPVSSDGVDGYSSSGGTYTMKPAKLISVEFVDPGWLEAWATLFREPTSPWRIHQKPPGDKAAQIKALAPKVLGALQAMRAVAGPTPERKQTVHAIDADTKVVTAFRVRTEQSIQRWLVQVNDDYEIGLEGLGELGPLPPTTVEIQRWFLDAETKAAFLEKVRSVWKGGLDELILAHYVKDVNHTSWTEAALDVVQGWDAATYALRRKTTMDILDG